ncbi:MAG: hypothetical protein EPO61_02965 [Nitrospirae bacterium]|nr:MAG: hypothetical protein EPO61_02965 [Nitrospirota bacterium]
MHVRSPLFLLTGFFWLFLSGLLGVALFIGMMIGHPLPPQIRLVHVHAALVGGVAQMILGAILAFVPALLMTGKDRPESHPVLYGLINGGAVGMVAGFAAGQPTIVAASGLLVVLAFLAVLKDGLGQAQSSLVSPPLNLWFYGVALVALLAGLSLGEAMALRLFPVTLHGQARLAHIHLNLLGFATLAIVGTMHNLLPTVLNVPLYSQKLARWTFALLPAGMALLIAGFLLGDLRTEIAAGAVIIAGTLLYGYNIVQTWIAAGRPGRIASDHFLLATFFLVLTAIGGLCVAINSLWEPAYVPIGKLHLVAYTHLALIGFILQTVIGALSHLLPIMLVVKRVKSHKKRGPYLEALTGIVEQWRPLQVVTLNMGTVALLFTAGLVWQYSLRVPAVQTAAWISAGLLAVGLLIFGLKVIRLLRHQPPEQSAE